MPFHKKEGKKQTHKASEQESLLSDLPRTRASEQRRTALLSNVYDYPTHTLPFSPLLAPFT